jgi:hypothetical protein
MGNVWCLTEEQQNNSFAEALAGEFPKLVFNGWMRRWKY